jgi:heme O synthase-like polyprenyltransferase
MAWQSAVPAALLIPISMIPILQSYTSLIYPVTIFALNWTFFYFGAKLAIRRSNAAARRLMLASILYVPCVLALMVLNKLVAVTRY